MTLEITKACADSLRTFTQSNYGIQLKSSHAHELVAAFFGYSSRAALLADKKCPISNLTEAEIIILNPSPPLVGQRLKALENLSSQLPAVDLLSKGVYAPIVADQRFADKIWPSLREAAMALVKQRAEEFKMFGTNIGEMEWISDVNINTSESGAEVSVIFDYPTNQKNPQRHSKLDLTLLRISGQIGFIKLEAKPTFYHGHMTDPDFRLNHGID